MRRTQALQIMQARSGDIIRHGLNNQVRADLLEVQAEYDEVQRAGIRLWSLLEECEERIGDVVRQLQWSAI